MEFLNVTLDLKNDRYFVYRKENNEINYIHSKSNHPSNVIRDIPIGINRMLNQLSSDKDMFEKEAIKYQEALNKNEYEHELKYEKVSTEEISNNKNRKKNNRKRGVLLYNPP